MTPGASPRVNRTSVKLKRRNNVGKWPIKPVVPENRQKDFAYYVAKDLRMAADASHGLMLWDAKSNGTLNNMINRFGSQLRRHQVCPNPVREYNIGVERGQRQLIRAVPVRLEASSERRTNVVDHQHPGSPGSSRGANGAACPWR